jgi:hypothetical protein
MYVSLADTACQEKLIQMIGIETVRNPVLEKQSR